VNDYGLKLIAQGRPCWNGFGGLGADEYGQTCYNKLDWSSWFPVSDYTFLDLSSGRNQIGTDGSYVWGPFEGDSFSYEYGDGAYFLDQATLNPGSQIIGNVNINGQDHPWIIANDKVFWIGAHRQEGRLFMSFDTSMNKLYDLDDQKKILTALSWFDYNSKFSVSDKYIGCQVFNRPNGVMVVFGNDKGETHNFDFKIDSLTSYGLVDSKDYKFYWANDWAPVSRIYTGQNLRNGISLISDPYTVSSLMVYENKGTPLFVASNATNTNEVYDGLNNKFRLEFDCEGSYLSAIHSPNKPNKIYIKGSEIFYDENLSGRQSWKYDEINKILMVKFEC
jgi:hypothetical protein